MGISLPFKKKENFLAIDIGSSSVKLIELDRRSGTPKLVNLAMAPLTADCFANNSISQTEKVSQQIHAILEANSIPAHRVVTAMPGPGVFTKRIKMQLMEMSELSSYIQMEASNFIPHSVDAVRLDYHVSSEIEHDQMDVLVVAVKNEVVDSFIESLSLCGLETAVVDVDYFALQNMFEMSYPEEVSKTIALINIGSRYCSINICCNGESLFTGDLALGGKAITDALAEELNLSIDEAEKLKRKKDLDKPEFDAAREIIARNVDYMASELNRQLSFFWSATGSEGGIEKIYLAGGASLTSGLDKDLAAKTEIPCEVMDCFRGLDCGDTFDQNYLKEIAPFMSIGVGMATRQPGDRIIPEFE
ncbi:MAG: type IV pilus assembly protein PilM [Deltaproteobacteria bacterium]|nr:type IV pilus assembly protein PilM [Deltaproteobacteria bacterium]